MMSRGVQDLDELERALFWSLAETRPGVLSCWIWKGRRDEKSGYGRFFAAGVAWQAHRVSFSLMHESDPTGLLVLHSCDEKICVNPRHLRLGSGRENVEDALIAAAMSRIHGGDLAALPPGKTPVVPRKPRTVRRPRVVRQRDPRPPVRPMSEKWLELTARQSEILDYLSGHSADRGRPPTLRDIAARFGISSTNGVSEHLDALERKGRIRRDDRGRAHLIDPAGPCPPVSTASPSR